jgi:pyruvate/2-oxoglutarate dehydrogenase complex dihydrolipoamide dehydrogenase (E3) component
VIIIQRSEVVLSQADPEMAEFFHGPLIEQGVELSLGDGLSKFDPKEESINVRLLLRFYEDDNLSLQLNNNK